MEQLNTWSEVFLSSLRSFGESFMGSIPMIIGAILIFLIGWIFAKLLSGAVSRLLKLIKFNELADKVKATEYLNKANISLSPNQLVGKFIYWIMMLLVLITASDTLGWTNVSQELSKLISFLPQLLVAIIVFIIGTFIASFIRDLIAGATSSLGISTGRIISGFVFYLLFTMVTLTALRQAGVDTSIITSNLLLILGAVLLAAAISYGFASRDVLANILAGHMGRNTYTPGMDIEVAGFRGIVQSISSVGLIIEAADGTKKIVPTQLLMRESVTVF